MNLSSSTHSISWLETMASSLPVECDAASTFHLLPPIPPRGCGLTENLEFIHRALHKQDAAPGSVSPPTLS